MSKDYFPKLGKKLFLYTFLIPVLFVFVVSVATSATTYTLYRSSFESAMESNVSMLVSRLDIGFSQLEAKVTSTANNDYFLAAVREKNESRIAENLQNLTTSDSAFIGAIYYSEELTVTSSDVSGAPNYAEIRNSKGFEPFLDSEETSFSSIRDSSIAQAYYNYPYPNEDGILSLFRKIEDDSKNVLGVLEIDLSSQTVYTDFLSLTDFPYMNDSVVYLAWNSQILYQPDQTRIDWDYSALSETTKPVTEGNTFVTKKNLNSTSGLQILKDDSLTLSVPKWNFWSMIVLISCSILVADIFFVVLFYFIARGYAKANASRLNRIASEMEEETHRRQGAEGGLSPEFPDQEQK